MRKYLIGGMLLILIVGVVCGSLASQQSLLGTADPEQINSMQLEMKAASSDPVEAAFYRTVSRIRYNIDKQVYPPVGKGGSSPGVLLSALSSAFQQSQPQDTLSPEQRRAFLKRVSQWTPQFPMVYDPGWKYLVRVDDAKAEQITKATLAKIVVPLKQQARLLENEEYCKLVEEQKALEAKYNLQYSRDPSLRTNYKEAIAALQKSLDLEVPLHRIDCDVNPEKRWHNRWNWRAEDYFSDPAAIELCRAIEANDLAEMQRLIDEGANVNAAGEGGMTLLLWAMPDGRFERFELLLKSGANPSVKMTTKFDPPGPIQAGPSALLRSRGTFCSEGRTVIDIAAGMANTEYFRKVIEHGTANQVIDKEVVEALLPQVLKSRRYGRARLLAEAGFEVATENDSMKRYRRESVRLSRGAAHFLVENGPGSLDSDYEELLSIAQQRGADFDAAVADVCDWESAKLERAIERFFLRTKWTSTRDRPSHTAMAAEVEKFLADRKEQLAKLDSDEQYPTVQSRLAKLTEKELADIELPTDPDATVFALKIAGEAKPLLTVKANGTLEVKQKFSSDREYVTGVVSEDELKWLLHLAVRKDREIHVTQPRMKHQINPLDFLHVTVNVASGSDQYIAPYPAANSELKGTRQNFDGQRLILWSRYLGHKVQCGGDGELEKIVTAVNKKFADLRPDLPLVRPQQIASVDSDQGRTLIEFYRSYKTAPHSGRKDDTRDYFEKSWATYRKIGDKTFVTARTTQQGRWPNQ